MERTLPETGTRPIALVTGGSRGIGRGVALGLCEANFDVFASGRSIEHADLPPSVRRIRCDHLSDDDTASAFRAIAAQDGGLDLLVTCAWGGYERMVEAGVYTWPAPFWEQPSHRWNAMMDGGVRAALMCATHAVRLMIPRRRGLIVNLSFWAAQRHIGNVIYGMAKAATDKMTADMAEELKPHGISAISLYPGLVRTEAVMQAADGGAFDLTNSESPQFIGRVVAALFADPNVMERSGTVQVAASVAEQYGVKDIDGSQPRALTLADVEG